MYKLSLNHLTLQCVSARQDPKHVLIFFPISSVLLRILHFLSNIGGRELTLFSGNKIFSDSRNPFVEHAIQYAIAAAHLASDKDKEALHKLFLQGNLQVSAFSSFYFSSSRG